MEDEEWDSDRKGSHIGKTKEGERAGECRKEVGGDRV